MEVGNVPEKSEVVSKRKGILEQDVILSGPRERKATNFLGTSASDTDGPKKKTAVALGQGKGVLLGDYSFFTEQLSKVKGDSEVVKALHSLIYGKPGKKLESKKELRAFNGLPNDDKDPDHNKVIVKVLEKKKQWTVSLLKEALGLFGCEKGGDREELVKRLVQYLALPKIVKKENNSASGKKRRKSSTKLSKGKKKGKRVKTERAPSAYLLFTKSARATIKAEQPDISFTDMAVTLAAKWKNLDDAEKEVSATQALKKPY